MSHQFESYCFICGQDVDVVEVAIPHATKKLRQAFGVRARGTLCTTLCRTCVRNAVAAWASHPKGKLSQADA